ncbi:MAG TPA: hypothetical protein VGZ03_00355 [Acidimicrobiales bacterium]|nr:hypothetical protein [Acidimicrobiales bacterium]
MRVRQRRGEVVVPRTVEVLVARPGLQLEDRRDVARRGLPGGLRPYADANT